MENYIREMTINSMRLRIKEIREKLSVDGQLSDDLRFSVNPKDLEKCCTVGQKDLATYDIILNKIWIWLFRINNIAVMSNLPEDEVIRCIIFNIEHEWLHRLDSECVGKYKYSNLDKKIVERIVLMQQQ